MARLHEYQGKALLKEYGIGVPDGRAVRTPQQAAAAVRELGGRVVLKVQAWTTGRAEQGGIRFAESAEQAEQIAGSLLSMRFGNFPVTEVLVEEAIDIADELFISLSIDDAAMAPVLLLDFAGGSGIEQRASDVIRLPVDVKSGIDRDELVEYLQQSQIDAALHEEIVTAIESVVALAKSSDARSLEINPLVTTKDGRVLAADCRMTIDDYAVFRHPELNIEIARELDHPATDLERIAYKVEQNDHRGTFYFTQLSTEHASPSTIIGFHGAGGGGSMMSMDAATNEGFALANFCDTSGNPSAAKVYRAARIILSQPGIVGYFGSGSGVASQEQYHSAYGLTKAFLEMNMSVPVVVRLGGNSEDRAVEILHDACRELSADIEGYKKDDTPKSCGQRFRTLVDENQTMPAQMTRHLPEFVNTERGYSFSIPGGTVWIDHSGCDDETTSIVLKHAGHLLKANEKNKPVLAVGEEEIATKDSELIALEIECHRAGKPVLFVDLELPSLEEAQAA